MAARSVTFQSPVPDVSSFDLDPEQDSDLSNSMSSLSFDSSYSSDECKTPSPTRSFMDESRTPSPFSPSISESSGASPLSSSPTLDESGTSSAASSSDDNGFTTPPSSPSKGKSVPKVTPEKMKQFCLKASAKPPQPLFQHDVDEEEQPLLSNWAVRPWIHAHQPNVKEVLSEVITTVRYVSHRTFLNRLAASVGQVNLRLAGLYGPSYTPGAHCIVLTQERKSNLWVAELAKQHFRFIAERYMDLGLNDADQFVAMLEGVSRDMVIVREKFYNRTIVLFDDASYSGKQLSSHLLQVRRAIHEYQLVVKEIVVIAPFATPFAQARILEASRKRIGKVASAYIAPAVKLPMLSDLDPASYDLIVNLWYKGKREEAAKIGLAYFQHKVPNDQSFPVALARGSVYHLGKDDKGVSQKESFPILEDVIPDYKGTTAERFAKT